MSGIEGNGGNGLNGGEDFVVLDAVDTAVDAGVQPDVEVATVAGDRVIELDTTGAMVPTVEAPAPRSIPKWAKAGGGVVLTTLTSFGAYKVAQNKPVPKPVPVVAGWALDCDDATGKAHNPLHFKDGTASTHVEAVSYDQTDRESADPGQDLNIDLTKGYNLVWTDSNGNVVDRNAIAPNQLKCKTPTPTTVAATTTIAKTTTTIAPTTTTTLPKPKPTTIVPTTISIKGRIVSTEPSTSTTTKAPKPNKGTAPGSASGPINSGTKDGQYKTGWNNAPQI